MNQTNNILVKRRGFSFLEVIIALGIVAIAAAAILTAGVKRNSRSLDVEAEKLAAMLRRAQSLAIAKTTYDGQVPTKGYGVQVTTGNPASYILITDSRPGNPCMRSASLETYALPREVQLQFFEVAANPSAVGMVDICFRPDGTAYRQGSAGENFTVQYVVSRMGGSLAKAIVIRQPLGQDPIIEVHAP
ncbi:MAG: prepilin-type N-terminal cleavage/methylation domain-containing protein [Parcubacteria group bacterium]|nr:prepilin-type N-terminal cleavage/methylation domain-containing protein [Parcubacteria group bacterium]